MAFVAAAIGAAAIGGGATIGGAYLQSQAAKDAAGMQADASRYAADLQYKMYQQQRDDTAPWRQAGAQALSQMGDPYFQQNFGKFDMSEDPGYQFRLEQGQKALEASAAARGGLLSGNTGQALMNYGQDYASNEYQNAYNRFTNNQTNRFNRLASIAGIGQTSVNALGQAGQSYAAGAGGAMMGAANANAASTIAQGNVWGGALSGIGNNIGNSWMQASMMNKFFPSGGGGGNQFSMPGYSANGSGTAGQGYYDSPDDSPAGALRTELA